MSSARRRKRETDSGSEEAGDARRVKVRKGAGAARACECLESGWCALVVEKQLIEPLERSHAFDLLDLVIREVDRVELILCRRQVLNDSDLVACESAMACVSTI